MPPPSSSDEVDVPSLWTPSGADLGELAGPEPDPRMVNFRPSIVRTLLSWPSRTSPGLLPLPRQGSAICRTAPTLAITPERHKLAQRFRTGDTGVVSVRRGPGCQLLGVGPVGSSRSVCLPARTYGCSRCWSQGAGRAEVPRRKPHRRSPGWGTWRPGRARRPTGQHNQPCQHDRVEHESVQGTAGQRGVDAAPRL
jgi:hypothetical protein